MRTRNIKPGLFQNELLAELPFEGRLLFAGLPLLADRAGRLEDRPRRIKAALFPFDDSVAIDDLLADLAERDFITRYQVEAVAVIQITKFLSHQSPHPKEAESQLPENPNKNARPRKATASHGNSGTSRAGSSGSSGSLGSSGSSSEPLTAAAEPPSPAVLTFPCVGAAKSWDLTEAQLAKWTDSYRPGLDVLTECRKAQNWLDANPARRKTASGMPKFIVNWLNRAVDRGAGRVQALRHDQRPVTPRNVCKHTPPCRDEAEHTRRDMAERRQVPA